MRVHLLLHEGGGAGDAVLLEDAEDGAAGGAEDALGDARGAGRHRAGVLAAQLLHQLRKLRAQLGAIAAAGHPLRAQPCHLPRACRPCRGKTSHKLDDRKLKIPDCMGWDFV